ncbi:unnamed protein product [Owenia fusiformis]|uniref:Uncharacterized protein n=1 Tax=Owenia fusiformis TaxID=6347 RepID=A0A8J1XJN7_OWEFU|nr:unnamed protein product [Owenia fusiformis]
MDDTTTYDNLTGNERQVSPLPFWLTSIHVIVEVVLIIFIAFGNMLIIRSFFKFSKLQTTTNVFIVALAIGDFVVGAFGIPFGLVASHIANYMGEAGYAISDNKICCQVRTILLVVPLGSSVFSLCAVSIDRHIAVTKPLRYHAIMTHTKAVLICVCIVVYMFGLTILGLTAFYVWNTTTACRLNNTASSSYNTVIKLHIGILYGIACALYIHIGIIAVQQRKKVCAIDPMAEMQFKKDNKITKMMMFVLGVFLLTWSPYIIFGSITSNPEPVWLTSANYFAIEIAYANSMMNPLIYASRNKAFNTAFRELLGLRPKFDKEGTEISYDKDNGSST